MAEFLRLRASWLNVDKMMALEFQPGTVLLDLGLPGMNGYEVARRLRQEPGLERLLLIAISGYGMAEDRHRSAEAGFALHLVKPVEPEELERLLAFVLQLRSSRAAHIQSGS